jgi:hypothetical protein
MPGWPDMRPKASTDLRIVRIDLEDAGAGRGGAAGAAAHPSVLGAAGAGVRVGQTQGGAGAVGIGGVRALTRASTIDPADRDGIGSV